jgi:diacylglycerol kinase (ATP)
LVKTLVVVNPNAAGGRAGRTFEPLRGVIERRMGPVDVALTERRGHAIDLAKQAVRGGYTLLVAVGGDGTFHEVANGVLEAGGLASVGHIGQGTGGDFRRALDIPHRLDLYLDAIVEGRDRAVDVGRIRYRTLEGETRTRYFVNILSAGMSGLVDRYVERTTKAFGGKAAYFLASLRALADCRRVTLRCRSSLHGAPDSRDTSAYLIAICNGSYFGGGMRMAPMARPDDGRFEVVSMSAPSRLAFAAFSRRIYEGRHVELPGVQHFGCDRIAIDVDDEASRGSFLLDVDGEALGTLPIDVELVPAALRVRAPALRS